ncbi:MAG: hypothetical protein WBA72_03635 [Ornithinimicrobium sp.]
MTGVFRIEESGTSWPAVHMDHLIRVAGYPALYEVEESLKAANIKWKHLRADDPLIDEHDACDGSAAQFFIVVTHDSESEVAKALAGEGPGAVIVDSYETRTYPAT